MQHMIGQSTRLFDIFGTPVYVHRSFVILLGIVMLLFGVLAGALAQGFALCLAIVLSLLVHEFGHVLAAKSNGHRSVVVLWMVGGLTISEARSPGWRGVWLSVAGPLAGFLFWALLWFGLGSQWVDGAVLTDWSWIFSPTSVGASLGSVGTLFWGYLCFMNLIWGLFNLLPVSPLDGGHVVDDLLRMRLRAVEAERIAGWIGVLAGIGGGIFLLQATNFLMAPVMLFYLAYRNYQRVQATR